MSVAPSNDITGATAWLVDYRLDKPVGGSGVAQVDVIMVELTDRDGVTGLGFTYALGGGGAVVLKSAQVQIDDFVRSRALVHPRALWRDIARSFNRTGFGPNLIALAAIDVAAWDLYGKRLSMPLSAALGGTPRAVEVYGSGGFTATQEIGAAVASANAYAARGFAAVKPRMQGSRRDAALLTAVRKAVGDDIHIMADANERCDLAAARWLMGAARDHGVLFVEEPLPASELAGYRALARSSSVAIATGEHLQSAAEFLPYISESLVGVIQPDLAMAGGITPILDLCTLAESFGVAVSPHFLPGLFIHIAAASPSMTRLEDFPLLEPVFDGWPHYDARGRLLPTTRPGHGLTVTARYRREGPAC